MSPAAAPAAAPAALAVALPVAVSCAMSDNKLDSSSPPALAMLLQLSSQSANAASALSRLWKQSAHAKLLQRQPTDHTSIRYTDLFRSTAEHTRVLDISLATAQNLHSKDSSLNAEGFLGCTYVARPVAMLAQLLVWLQKAPQLLQLPEERNKDVEADDFTSCGVWVSCNSGTSTITEWKCTPASVRTRVLHICSMRAWQALCGTSLAAAQRCKGSFILHHTHFSCRLPSLATCS
jgi:hypothetical protein